jgi:hypothetical protein
MASGVLIDTSNRLLGWSTNDFSLYGGQAAVTIGAPAAPSHASNGLSVPDPAATARAAEARPAPAQEELSRATDSHDDAPSLFQASPFAAPPIQFGGFTQANGSEAVVPAALGSGMPTPSFDAMHMPAILPASLAPPTLAIEQPEVQAPSLAPWGGMTVPVLGVSDALDLVVSTTGALADTLLAETQQAIDGLSHVTDALFDNSPLTAADGFLGSDPVAGVATLVSMVDSTDAFDLAHTGLDIPHVTASGSILDTLADEAIASPLLGDVVHDADSLVPDPHHDGVLGLS